MTKEDQEGEEVQEDLAGASVEALANQIPEFQVVKLQAALARQRCQCCRYRARAP